MNKWIALIPLVMLWGGLLVWRRDKLTKRYSTLWLIERNEMNFRQLLVSYEMEFIQLSMLIMFVLTAWFVIWAR